MALAVAPTVADEAVLFAPTAIVTRGHDHTLVSLRGEYDIASLYGLAESLAIAIALDDGDLVVDLSKFEFMGAETVGVLMRARRLLREQSRSITLRAPAACAQRVLDLCEFTPRPALAS